MKEKKKRFFRQSKKESNEKEVEKIMENLKDQIVLVEGKRDKKALENLGINNVYPVVGRIEAVYSLLQGLEVKEVVLLTDLDKKGNQLADRLYERLWSMGIKTDKETRRKLGKILRVKYFEELNKKYKEFKGE